MPTFMSLSIKHLYEWVKSVCGQFIIQLLPIFVEGPLFILFPIEVYSVRLFTLLLGVERE